jgi:hypothetical protein
VHVACLAAAARRILSPPACDPAAVPACTTSSLSSHAAQHTLIIPSEPVLFNHRARATLRREQLLVQGSCARLHTMREQVCRYGQPMRLFPRRPCSILSARQQPVCIPSQGSAYRGKRSGCVEKNRCHLSADSCNHEA